MLCYNYSGVEVQKTNDHRIISNQEITSVQNAYNQIAYNYIV